MSYIEEIDKLIDNGEFKRARDICEEHKNEEEVQLRMAKIIYLDGKYGLAESICREHLDNPEYEKLLITILTKQGKVDFSKYYEALELCYHHMKDDIVVKSQFVKILIKMERYDEAEKACLEEKDNTTFVSQLIKSYIKQGKYDKAKAICEKRLDEPTILSQYVTALIGEGNIEKAKEICMANPDSAVLQSQLITMFMKEDKYQEAKEIALKHLDSSAIRGQLRNINRCMKFNISSVKDYYNNRDSKRNNNYAIEKNEEKREKLENKIEKRKDKKDRDDNEIPYIDIVKTKIYMDDIPREYIEDLKKSDLDPWEKSIAIIAIYKKKNETKNAELALKEAKRIFKEAPSKIKKLNSLISYVSSNKQKMFDWNAFDQVINWEINEDYATKIRLRREEDKLIEQGQNVKKEQEEVKKIDENKEEQLREEVQKEVQKQVEENESKEVVIEGLQQVAVVELKKEEPVKAEVEEVKEEIKEEIKEEAKQEQVQPTKKVKKNKNKGKGKNKKEQDLEDKMMIDVYKTEIMKLKSKIANSNNIKEFYVVDNIEEKPATDLRAKMQIVMYLRKYGLDKVALEGFPQEYEIYDLINKMMMYKRADSKYDDSKILEEIMEKASKIDGNNEYIYKLLDDVTKKNAEQR